MYIVRLVGTIGTCALLGCSSGSLGEVVSAGAPQSGTDVMPLGTQSKDGLLFVSYYENDDDWDLYRRGSEHFMREIARVFSTPRTHSQLFRWQSVRCSGKQ